MFSITDIERDNSKEERLISIEIAEPSEKWDKKEYNLNIEIEKRAISIKNKSEVIGNKGKKIKLLEISNKERKKRSIFINRECKIIWII